VDQQPNDMLETMVDSRCYISWTPKGLYKNEKEIFRNSKMISKQIGEA